MDSPDYLRICQFEDCLKKRIHYNDRLERIDKVLLALKIVSPVTHYCSRNELSNFKSAVHDDYELLTAVMEGLVEGTINNNDSWFDLYREITGHRGLAEKQLEKQVQLQQEEQRARLERKRARLQAIKDSFIASEIQRIQTTPQERAERRRSSAPRHINAHREHAL